MGVTRARSKLFLTRAKKRLARGKVRERAPSPYLADIEEQLLERRRARLPDAGGERARTRSSTSSPPDPLDHAPAGKASGDKD